MGKITRTTQPVPFTSQDVNNEELVTKMLLWEQDLMKSDEGQSRYKNELNNPYISLTNEYAFNRQTLSQFGFDTTDSSVENYRNIFKTYFRSPDDYNHNVINSSYYMKNNRCIYYRSPIINIGDKIPNVSLFTSDGTIETTVYDAIHENGGSNITVIAAFSMS